MRYIQLNGRECTNHDYLIKKISLPNYYGRNLDALYDCLQAVTLPTIIGLIDQHIIVNQLGKDGQSFIKLLKDVNQQNKNIRIIIR